MNRSELSQIYYLAREIRLLEQELKETESQWRKIDFAGRTNSGSSSDKISTLLCAIDGYKEKIEHRLIEQYKLKTAAENYIGNLDDCQLRIILRERFVKCRTWYEIARTIGSPNESTPRRMIDRFFEERDMSKRCTTFA